MTPKPGHRHAPKGPIKTANPMQPLDPTRCKATRRNGDQCGSKPIRGGTVCRMHGGGAPQVKAKAAERLAIMANKALGVIDRLMDREEFPTVQLGASKTVYEWQHGKATERVNATVDGDVTLRWQSS